MNTILYPIKFRQIIVNYTENKNHLIQLVLKTYQKIYEENCILLFYSFLFFNSLTLKKTYLMHPVLKCSQYLLLSRGHGATVARLIPDQKVGCSNHPVLMFFFYQTRQFNYLNYLALNRFVVYLHSFVF